VSELPAVAADVEKLDVFGRAVVVVNGEAYPASRYLRAGWEVLVVGTLGKRDVGDF
jgi:hypothetical protein